MGGITLRDQASATEVRSTRVHHHITDGSFDSRLFLPTVSTFYMGDSCEVCSMVLYLQHNTTMALSPVL